MMQDWADLLEQTQRGAKVLSFRIELPRSSAKPVASEQIFAGGRPGSTQARRLFASLQF